MPIVLVIIGVVIIGGAVAYSQLGSEPAPESGTEPTARVEDAAGDGAEVEVIAGDGIESTPAVSEPEPAMNEPAPTNDAADSAYVDGTYSAAVEYRIPSGLTEPLKVELTLEKDIVTAAAVELEGRVGTSRLYQKKFTEAYQAEVVGQSIDDLELSRVGGASLTSGGFNEAVAEIQAEAAV